MEKLLKKLGIDASLTDEEILAALEKKQMEYLDRLDSVEDDERRKELKDDLSDIESTISSLSWTLKRRNSGITNDASETGIMVDEEEAQEEKQEESLTEQMTNSGGKDQQSSEVKEKKQSHNLEMARNYLYGIAPYHEDSILAAASFRAALDDELSDEERGEALASLGLIEIRQLDNQQKDNFYYNIAMKYVEDAISLGNSYAYYLRGFLMLYDLHPKFNHKVIGWTPLDAYRSFYNNNDWDSRYDKNVMDEIKNPGSSKEKHTRRMNMSRKYDEVKAYFDKSIELGVEDAKEYMWLWDLDFLLENGFKARAKEVAKEDGDAWYKIYQMTHDINDLRYAVEKGSAQAKQELPAAEHALKNEYREYERKSKLEDIGDYIKTFFILLIPSAIVGTIIAGKVFNVDNYGSWGAIIVIVDIIATIIWHRLF